MFCSKCGATNAEGTRFCSSCGANLISPNVVNSQSVNVPVYKQVPVNNVASQKASLAKILGIISLFTSFFVGYVFAIVAIVFAQMSKRETGEVLSSEAKVGQNCAIVSLVLSTIAVMIYVVLLILDM